MVWATCGRCRLCACKGAVRAGANALAPARSETTSHLSMVVVALLLGSAVWRRCYGVESSVCSTSKAVDAAAATAWCCKTVRRDVCFRSQKTRQPIELAGKMPTSFYLPSFPAMHDKAQETCNRGLRPGSLLASCEALACYARGGKAAAARPCCCAVTSVHAELSSLTHRNTHDHRCARGRQHKTQQRL